jgi:hypothetical protein
MVHAIILGTLLLLLLLLHLYETINNKIHIVVIRPFKIVKQSPK